MQGIDTEQPDGVRDRALLLLGLAGAFRRDELVSLDLAHLRFDDDGLVVELPKSKTHQKGEAEKKPSSLPQPAQLPGARRQGLARTAASARTHERTLIPLFSQGAATESAPAEHL